MATFESTPFPLVELQAVSNAQNEWLALTLRATPRQSDPDSDSPDRATAELSTALGAVFAAPDLLTAIAPLDCVVMLDSPAALTPELLTMMPPNRVSFAIAAPALGVEDTRKQIIALHDSGYRVLIDGIAAEGVTVPPALRAVSLDVGGGAAIPSGKAGLLALFGPHLARGIDSGVRQAECARGGFEWFSGPWPLKPIPSKEPNDGTSRKRLLTLLGLLARDAESRELETLLKQDPALSYHLLKLVNSAAFALSTPITSFGQAINLLGRRQLQRWLQLLLYARQEADGMANPLLPLAALRAAQLEMLAKQQGGERDDQDLAFMTGVFSLLDVLFDMPMSDIVGALKLDPAAADALLARGGRLGHQLRLIESGVVTVEQLTAIDIDPEHWWQSQLHAYHWAIQVSRNL